jgi:hypothetical protein
MEPFWKHIRAHKAKGNEEKAMELLWYMAYSPHETIAHLDFDRYSLKDFEMALYDLYDYQSDDTLDMDSLENPNVFTMIYDLNRLTHIGEICREVGKKARLSKKKRRFI